MKTQREHGGFPSVNQEDKPWENWPCWHLGLTL